MYKNRKGFTLNELMIVIAVIAIVGAISIPTIVNSMPKYRLKKSARDLCSNMRKARMIAVKQNRNVAITFDLANNEYTIDGAARPTQLENGIVFGFGDATVAATEGGGSLPGDPVTLSAETATFNSRGFLQPTSGYVYFQNARGEALALSVLTSGSIRLRKWRGTSWEWE